MFPFLLSFISGDREGRFRVDNPERSLTAGQRYSKHSADLGQPLNLSFQRYSLNQLIQRFLCLLTPLLQISAHARRSVLYAMFVPWYNKAVRDYFAGEKLDAGSNDLFMSVYLPYCDRFVTDDEGQHKSLREVVSVAGLETEILSYDDFCKSILVTA